MACCKDKGDPKLAGSIDFNSVLKQIGYWGKFHWIQFGLLWIVSLSAGIGIVSFVFTGYLPKHRCFVPQCEQLETATYYTNPVSHRNKTLDKSDLVFNDYVLEALGNLNDADKKHSCERVSFEDDPDSCDNFVAKLKRNSGSVGQRETVKCSQDELVFDKSIVDSSFSTYYGLMCSRFYLRGIFNSLVMVGMLLGSVTVGVVSDHLGRKRTLQIVNLLLAAAGVTLAFRPPIIVFAICRVIIGMCSIGTYLCAIVCLIESTLDRMTAVLNQLLAFSFPAGELIMVAVAVSLRTEDELQHALYWPILLLQIPLFFVMESTRWLIAKGRIEEAKDQIAKMAKINGKVSPIKDTDNGEVSLDAIDNGNYSANSNKINEKKDVEKINYLNLFRPSKILIRTLILFLQWFSVTAIFYSLTYGSTSLAGDPYINFVIGVCFDLPGIIVSTYIVDRLGRKLTETIFMTTGGLLVLASGLIIQTEDSGTAVIVMFGVARLCASICYGTVYPLAMEMYPTKIRGSALGTCSTIGRIGGVFGLAIDGLKEIWYPLPIIIIGSVGIVAGILAFFLPETAGEKLPETTEEALEIGKNYKKVPWCKLTLFSE